MLVLQYRCLGSSWFYNSSDSAQHHLFLSKVYTEFAVSIAQLLYFPFANQVWVTQGTKVSLGAPYSIFHITGLRHGSIWACFHICCSLVNSTSNQNWQVTIARNWSSRNWSSWHDYRWTWRLGLDSRQNILCILFLHTTAHSATGANLYAYATHDICSCPSKFQAFTSLHLQPQVETSARDETLWL